MCQGSILWERFCAVSLLQWIDILLSLRRPLSGLIFILGMCHNDPIRKEVYDIMEITTKGMITTENSFNISNDYCLFH